VASIRINGHEVVGSPGRGYWIAALAPADGRVLGARRFDIEKKSEESERLVSFIEGWPVGTILVAVAMAEPESQLTERVVRALQSIGGRGDLRGTGGWSHALIGARGATPGDAVEEWGPRTVRAIVGRDRRLGVTLETFELL
jgi:hypothetical protein